MSLLRQLAFALTAVIATMVGAPASGQSETVLRAVMHSDLKILDPVWTTAYIVRNHGYMVYDTLFATDESGEIKPQMVDKYDASAEKLTKEQSKILVIWHEPSTRTEADIEAIRSAYKARFDQESVMRVDSLSCVSF